MILAAVATVSFTTLARLALSPVLGSHGLFLFAVIAVVVSTLWAGAWAGLTAIVLSIPTFDYLFISPRYTWFIHDARSDSITLVLFAVFGLLTALAIDQIFDIRTRLTQSVLNPQGGLSQLYMIDASVPEGLFTAAEDGTAEHLSRFFAKYSGQELCSLGGTGWLHLVHPDDLNVLLAGLSRQQGAGQHFERIIRLRRKDGKYRSFKCHAAQKLDPNDGARKWFGVCCDIDNERELIAALRGRTQDLFQTNQCLERFACSAAHDFTEPLRTIGATTELFLRQKRSDLDDESFQMLTSVVQAVGRMKRLLRNTLNLARAKNVESGRVDVQAVIESAMANLAQAIAENSAKIVVDDLPMVWANEGAMLRLFQNLIGNSLKYRTHTAPEIYISATLQGADYFFSVKDNGIGIDPEFRDEIFEPFRRLHPYSQYEGSGLGLAACRRILKALNGKIWVESKPGEGSTFVFTIPKR